MCVDHGSAGLRSVSQYAQVPNGPEIVPCQPCHCGRKQGKDKVKSMGKKKGGFFCRQTEQVEEKLVEGGKTNWCISVSVLPVSAFALCSGLSGSIAHWIGFIKVEPVQVRSGCARVLVKSGFSSSVDPFNAMFILQVLMLKSNF